MFKFKGKMVFGDPTAFEKRLDLGYLWPMQRLINSETTPHVSRRLEGFERKPRQLLLRLLGRRQPRTPPQTPEIRGLPGEAQGASQATTEPPTLSPLWRGLGSPSCLYPAPLSARMIYMSTIRKQGDPERAKVKTGSASRVGF